MGRLFMVRMGGGRRKRRRRRGIQRELLIIRRVGIDVWRGMRGWEGRLLEDDPFMSDYCSPAVTLY
jgi:hypothetical protein